MSSITTANDTVRLGPEDIDQIVELEQRCFVPALQASAETLQQRFALEHTMLGIKAAGKLVAMLSFYYHRFDRHDLSSFPKNIVELGLRKSASDFDTAFFYNLEVDPDLRGRDCVARLMRCAFVQAVKDGCVQGVANCRVSSYAGGDRCAGAERIRQNPSVKAAIDRYLEKGVFPDQRDLLRDPTLALYHQMTGCQFLQILPDFAPGDTATGGIRVVAYGTRRDLPNARVMRRENNSASKITDGEQS